MPTSNRSVFTRPVFRRSVALPALALLSACTMPSGPSGPVEIGNSDDLQTAATSQPKPAINAKPQGLMLRGEVVLGHEIRTIKPCGSNTQYWLSLDAAGSQQAEGFDRGAYTPLYGELVGHFEPGDGHGFAADYPAKFKVGKINLLSAEIAGCNQRRDTTMASGTEPFWSAAIRHNQLVASSLGEKDRTFRLDDKKFTANRRVYQAGKATLTLDKSLCNDGMSDSIYGWTARFDDGNKSYGGCATLAADDPTLHWAGEYRGSTPSAGSPIETRLALNPDHSAKTVYRQDDEPPIIESGTWQQISDTEIHVMMTRHQGQRLVSERIYRRNGFSLETYSEILNGTRYSLGSEGLKLDLLVGSQQSPEAEQDLPADRQGINGSDAYNPDVERALKTYLEPIKDGLPPVHYRWLETDLNGDGKDELLALLDICGSGGCTLLVFEKTQHQENGARLDSKITLVHTPLQMGKKGGDGWHDLVLSVGGGGAKPSTRILQHTPRGYPSNPSLAPEAAMPDSSDTWLFADGIYPAHQGRLLEW